MDEITIIEREVEKLKQRSVDLDESIIQTNRSHQETSDRIDLLIEEQDWALKKMDWIPCLKEWNFSKRDGQFMSFNFLYNTLVVDLHFAKNTQIQNIKLCSTLPVKCKPWAKLIISLMMEHLNNKAVLQKYKGTNHVTLLLDEISQVACTMHELSRELKTIHFQHRLTVVDNCLEVVISSSYIPCEVTMATTIHPGQYPHQPMEWTVKQVHGKLKSEDLLGEMKKVKGGKAYLGRVFDTVSAALCQC